MKMSEMLSSVNNNNNNNNNNNGSSNNNQNHYISPDYLSPTAASFDTKSSPLALLAQTCSAIGSDATPNPKLLANIEKSTKMREKSSPSAGSTNGNGSPNEFHHRSSFKPYESSLRDNDLPDDLRVASRLKASSSSSSSLAKVITSPHHMNGSNNSNNERCESAASASSQHTRKSPPSASPKNSNEKSNSSSASGKSTTPTANASSSQEQQKISEKDVATLRSLQSSSGPYPSLPYLNGYPYGPYQLDLIAQHQTMLKAAALNPYLNYARMKAASNADMMMGICRDPYCTGCNLSSHLLSGKNGASACPPGCTCDHSMSKAMAANPAAAMAYHAQLAQLAAASQMPYVCNWVGPDSNYCGKRFSASDDLFQHLRAEHTGNAIPDALLNASSASTNSLLAAFPRAYPTPPLSPLSSARYHPYSKNPLLPPPPSASATAASSLAGLLPPHPSLAQYFSPYAALYPRMSSSNLQP